MTEIRPLYEYMFLRVYPFGDAPMGVPNLNELGCEGWRVANAGTLKFDDGECGWELMLEREIKKPTSPIIILTETARVKAKAKFDSGDQKGAQRIVLQDLLEQEVAESKQRDTTGVICVERQGDKTCD